MLSDTDPVEEDVGRVDEMVLLLVCPIFPSSEELSDMMENSSREAQSTQGSGS